MGFIDVLFLSSKNICFPPLSVYAQVILIRICIAHLKTVPLNMHVPTFKKKYLCLVNGWANMGTIKLPILYILWYQIRHPQHPIIPRDMNNIATHNLGLYTSPSCLINMTNISTNILSKRHFTAFKYVDRVYFYI